MTVPSLVPLAITRHEGCESNDCSFLNRGGQRTLMGWTPRYDRFGNLQNADPNKTTSLWECRTCNRSWKVVTQDGHDPVVTDMSL